VRRGGRIVEIGSYQGRSAIVLARAAAADVEVVAIDPHAGNDRGPRELDGTEDEGARDHAAFLANLERAGVRDRIHHVRLPSHDARREVDGPIELLYVDGAHRFVPARADLRDWCPRVVDGGTILIHDSFCSVGVTGAIAAVLVGRRDVEYVGRVGSLAEYRRGRLDRRTRWRSTLRQLTETPYFAWSLIIKTLIVLRLRRLTRFMGNPSGEWPY
jgi:predicted O-methyltransferase YrrM